MRKRRYRDAGVAAHTGIEPALCISRLCTILAQSFVMQRVRGDPMKPRLCRIAQIYAIRVSEFVRKVDYPEPVETSSGITRKTWIALRGKSGDPRARSHVGALSVVVVCNLCPPRPIFDGSLGAMQCRI